MLILQEGFTLIESLVAMLMLLATLGGLIPVFMSYRLAAIDNQIKTGAIAVAQKKLDEIRQTPWDDLPTGTSVNSVTTTENHMGKDYSAVRTYCPNGPVGNSLIGQCDAETKAIRIEVLYDTREILEIETVYTKFE